MPDREKVIRGLKCHSAHGYEMCFDCPYYTGPDDFIYKGDDDLEGVCCEEKLASDAIALLKEQEARVMTLEEIRERAETADPDPVFVERKSGATAWDLYTIDIIYHMAKRPYMGVRAWTSRPTEEQRKAVKWVE